MIKVIQYSNDDFELTVGCPLIGDRYAEAARRIRDVETATGYETTGSMGVLSIWSPGTGKLAVLDKNPRTHPVFFENTNYSFEIKCKPGIDQPRVHTQLRSIAERFVSKKRAGEEALTGWLNFGNDVGVCEFILLYNKRGEQKSWTFGFEVFPTKLDLRTDHKLLVQEVEKEYFGLSLDILKRTYVNFKPLPGEGNDLTWWSIFGAIFHDLIGAMRFVLNKPHSRLVNRTEQLTREELKMLTPALEAEYFRHRYDEGKRYTVTGKSLSTDTTENRFLKYTAAYAFQKFNDIRQYIEKTKKKELSKSILLEMEETGRQLKIILSHPFFRMIGEFKGITQESAVLQKKAGYSAIYSNWIILRRSVQLFEGVNAIEIKNIADLYQYWCFMKVKNILQSLLGKEPAMIDLANVQQEDLLFTLKSDNHPGVVFISETGDKIELYHEFLFTRDADKVYLNRVFTDMQRPDIILRITKNDSGDPYIFTYLFDAKYRIEADRVKKSCDAPPVDAIGQMHRYRDAIYHFDTMGVKGREIVGGYILFPGSDAVEGIRECSYFASIEDINIGGFPLVPGDRHDNSSLLEEHLREILFADSHSLLKKMIPHKGLQYGDTDETVLIVCPSLSAPDQGEHLLADGSMIYLLPMIDPTGKPQNIDLSAKIRYLAPVQDGRIFHYYQISGIVVKQRFRLCPPLLAPPADDNSPGDPNELYFVFYLTGKRVFTPTPEIASGNAQAWFYMQFSQLWGLAREK